MAKTNKSANQRLVEFMMEPINGKIVLIIITTNQMLAVATLYPLPLPLPPTTKTSARKEK